MATIKLDSSMSVDQDHIQVIKRISECYVQDKKISNFCDLVQSSVDPSQLYLLAENSNVAKPNEIIAYPDIVTAGARNARQRLYFGYFHEISSFYCVADNVLYFWNSNEPNNVYQNAYSGSFITSVIIGRASSSVFVKEVKRVIVISTDTHIYIYPIVNGNQIFNHQHGFFEKALNFKCNCLTISGNGIIFAGSEFGDVYSITYSVNQINVRDRKVKTHILPSDTLPNRIVSYCLSFLPPKMRFRSPISLICYDESSKYLAAVDTDSRIHFYVFQEGKGTIKHVSTYEPAFTETIVSINAVPISDSNNIRFIAFTKTGDRLFFANISFMLDEPDQIQIIKRRAGPSFLYTVDQNSGEMVGKVEDAYFSLGFSVFLCSDFVMVASPFFPIDRVLYDPQEKYELISNNYTYLGISSSPHLIPNHRLTLFNHHMIWQHVFHSPIVYLLTNEGSMKVDLCRPVDTLKKLVDESKGNFSHKVREWMWQYHYNWESPATTLLLASESPNLRRQALFILSQFSYVLSKNRDEFDKSLPPSSSAFLLRTARILEVFWHSPVFSQLKKRKNGTIVEKWRVSPLYGKVSTSFTEKLKEIEVMIEEYISILRSTTEQTKIDQQKEIADETHFLYLLTSYIRQTVEIITFIKIMKKQKKSYITTAISSLSQEYQNRLVVHPFGMVDTEITVFESMREFATKLFTSDRSLLGDHLALSLRRDCPSFFNTADIQIIGALNDLHVLRNSNSKDNNSVLEKICETILRHIFRPINLKEICSELKGHSFYKGIIDIALRRASAIDPTQQALTWFRGGRISTNEAGRTAFDKRYRCYEYIFEISDEPRAFEIMLSRNDELFHICLYQRFLSEKKITKILSMNTPFLIPFLEEFAPQYLWDYYAQHEDYSTAASRLFKMATIDDSSSISQRIEWLQKVTQFARGSGMNDMKKLAEHKLAVAQIQKDYSNRTNTYDTILIDEQTLLHFCCNQGHWDLVLKLINVCPVATDNKPQLISQVWNSYLIEMLWNEPLSIVSQKIESLTTDISPSSEVFSPSIVVPILEEFRMNRGGDNNWTVETLIRCNIKRDEILRNIKQNA